MPQLYIGKEKVQNVFRLLGKKEDDISYKVAWALAQCPSFLMLKTIMGCWLKPVEALPKAATAKTRKPCFR